MPNGTPATIDTFVQENQARLLDEFLAPLRIPHVTDALRDAGLESRWTRPTRAKTAIPAKATASFRVVSRQDPDKIVASSRRFLKDNAPAGIEIELRVLSAGPGESGPSGDCQLFQDSNRADGIRTAG